MRVAREKARLRVTLQAVWWLWVMPQACIYPLTCSIIVSASCTTEPFRLMRSSWYLMKQLLQETERTQPPAHQPSQQGSEQEQPSRHIHDPVARGKGGLQGAQRTGPHRKRAGITIQAGEAKGFQNARIGFSATETDKVSVGESGPENLYDGSFFNQGLYTPGR